MHKRRSGAVGNYFIPFTSRCDGVGSRLAAYVFGRNLEGRQPKFDLHDITTARR